MKYPVALALLATMIFSQAGCVSSRPDEQIPEIIDTDPMIVQLSSMARTAYASGNVPRALVLYRRALEKSRALDISHEIGRNAYNTATCLVALEEWEEAEKALLEAEQETPAGSEDMGPVLLLLAEVQSRQDHLREAWSTIDRLETLPLSETVRGQAYVMRADIARRRGDASTAESMLSRARGHLKKELDAGLAGGISRVSAEIAMLEKRWADAAAAFDRQAAWLQRSGRLYEMAYALDEAGKSYMAAGSVSTATDRFYRSARSFMAQQHYLGALRVIERAVELQKDDASGVDTARAVTELFREIQQSVESLSQAAAGRPQ
jgi:tetratricopeptide (TPR) repeat protein